MKTKLTNLLLMSAFLACPAFIPAQRSLARTPSGIESPNDAVTSNDVNRNDQSNQLNQQKREKYATMHEQMAACLRSDRPVADCKREMKQTCQQIKGTECRHHHHYDQMAPGSTNDQGSSDYQGDNQTEDQD